MLRTPGHGMWVRRCAARAFGRIVGCAWRALRTFGQAIGHAPVSREEEGRRRRRRCPGRDRSALCIARSATVGALPRHPVAASITFLLTWWRPAPTIDPG
ncbi:MAG TPA: hypothetical protein VF276_10755 [Chloroflexia bacterium]